MENTNINKKLQCINAMKLFAILLVINSHMDKLYPKDYFATGGALGNALFFIISGYFFTARLDFKGIIQKKIKRLYPETIIVTMLYYCLGYWDLSFKFIDIIYEFIFPTKFWFVGTLFLFYILIYLLEYIKFTENYIAFTIIMWICYFIYYIFLVDKTIWSLETNGIDSLEGFFKLIYYFYIFCTGFYIKKFVTQYKDYNKMLKLSLIFFFATLISKVLLQKEIIGMNMQFVCQIFGTLFAIFALLFSLSFESIYIKLSSKVRKVIDFISEHSMELYLLQFIVIYYSEDFVFPINIIIAILLTIFLAIILNYLMNIIYFFVSKLHNYS